MISRTLICFLLFQRQISQDFWQRVLEFQMGQAEQVATMREQLQWRYSQLDFYIVRIKFSEIKIRLFDGGGYELAVFPVALPRKTPKLPAYGEACCVVVNPYWYPTGPTRAYYKATRKMDLPKTIAPTDPRNAMGKAKIGIFFYSNHINQAVLIHGTNDPPSIGKRVSRGCIRMYNEDILKLISLIKGRRTLIVFEQ